MNEFVFRQDVQTDGICDGYVIFRCSEIGEVLDARIAVARRVAYSVAEVDSAPGFEFFTSFSQSGPWKCPGSEMTLNTKFLSG